MVGGVAGAATNAVKGDDVFDNLAEASIVAGEQLRNSLTGKLIARLANDLGKGQLVFCPQEWDVDITDPDYVDVSVVIGRLQADKRAFTYEPLELGDDILRVQTRGEVFSGLRISTDIAVSTKRLQVAVSPSKVLVARPGDTVPIAAQLVNADTTTLSWNTPHGKWADELGAITAEDGTRGLVTPTDVSVYPFTVEIESTSTTGLRAGATDVRGDIVVIDLQGLFVAPDPGSALTRQRAAFAATDRDGKAGAVTWTATGGSINGTGLYTAGKVPGGLHGHRRCPRRSDTEGDRDGDRWRRRLPRGYVVAPGRGVPRRHRSGKRHTDHQTIRATTGSSSTRTEHSSTNASNGRSRSRHRTARSSSRSMAKTPARGSSTVTN